MWEHALAGFGFVAMKVCATRLLHVCFIGLVFAIAAAMNPFPDRVCLKAKFGFLLTSFDTAAPRDPVLDARGLVATRFRAENPYSLCLLLVVRAPSSVSTGPGMLFLHEVLGRREPRHLPFHAQRRSSVPGPDSTIGRASC